MPDNAPCCIIGAHPQAESINAELKLGEGIRGIAARHNLSRSTLSDHKTRCLHLRALGQPAKRPADTASTKATDATSDAPTPPAQPADSPRTAAPPADASGQAKPKRKMGRPTECTPEMTAAIATDIERGMTLDDAAALNGINPSTLYEWRNRGDEGEQPYSDFAKAIAQARAKARATALANVRSGVLPSMAPDWKAEAWWLERMYPDEFGAQAAVAVKVEKELGAMLDTLKQNLDADTYHKVLGALAGENSGGEAGGGA